MIPAPSSAAPSPSRFECSICGEASADICVYCTKDACPNHRCDRCRRCSDCCRCEVPLDEAGAAEAPVAEAAAEPVTDLGAGSEPQPEPEPPVLPAEEPGEPPAVQ